MYALSASDVENASCEFDVETLSPTYRLLIGVPGKSNAFAISKKLGLEKEVLDQAKLHMDETDKSFDHLFVDLVDGIPMYPRDLLYRFDGQPPSEQFPYPPRCSSCYSRPRILERYFFRKACPAFRAAVAVHDDAQFLLAFHPYRHVPQRHAPAVVDVYGASAYWTACRLCPPTTLKQKHRFRPFRIHRVCFAFVSLTFDLDCDILFSEHVTTSSLFVSQLQLEVFHAPFVYRVSVNPTTFREEP
jgi:hypothetical protein